MIERSAITLKSLVFIAGVMPALVVIGDRAFYKYGEGRIRDNEASAIRALRSLATVQIEFRKGDKDGDGTLDYAVTLRELEKTGLIDQALGSGSVGGYRFSLSGATFDWQGSATPLSPRQGRRNFTICTDGVVHFRINAPVSCHSICIQ